MYKSAFYYWVDIYRKLRNFKKAKQQHRIYNPYPQ
jgi:hypothetical protein